MRSAARVLVTMKNGFTWQGFEADLRGGSFGRAHGRVSSSGKQVGDYSVYHGRLEAIGDRRLASPAGGVGISRRAYGDVGYRANARGSCTLNVTVGRQFMFGAAAAAPLQLLQQNWGSVYTAPQSSLEPAGDVRGAPRTYASSDTLKSAGRPVLPRVQPGPCRRQYDRRRALPALFVPRTAIRCMTPSARSSLTFRTTERSTSAKSTARGRNRVRSAAICRRSTPIRSLATTIS